MIKPDTGSVDFWGEKIAHFSPARFVDQKIARIPEDRHKEGVVGEMSLWENAISEMYKKFSRFGIINFGDAQRFTTELIDKYDIRCDGIDKETRLLSGGNM